jgi:hypothetical protein
MCQCTVLVGEGSTRRREFTVLLFEIATKFTLRRQFEFLHRILQRVLIPAAHALEHVFEVLLEDAV